MNSTQTVDMWNGGKEFEMLSQKHTQLVKIADFRPEKIEFNLFMPVEIRKPK